MVFVHGYALNLDCWHFQRLALPRQAAGWCFYDQRSHGRSRAVAEGATPRSTSSATTSPRCSTQLAPDGPVVLVGHSMGGMSIMALAEQHPELFGDRVVGVGAGLHDRRGAAHRTRSSLACIPDAVGGTVVERG